MMLYNEYRMKYVRCINNRAYLRFKGELPIDDVTDLTVGHIYKVVPPTAEEQQLGHLRVIEDTGEDYLFPDSYFEPVAVTKEALVANEAAITVHLAPILKDVLRAEALAANKPISALLRDWIDERLDLPEPA
jgi:hypothetical protein